MSRSCCQSFVSFTLRFLNFLQTFIGVSIILYSLWMLNHWSRRAPVPLAPTPGAPAPDAPAVGTVLAFGRIALFNLAGVGAASGADLVLRLNLPAPWFIYLFMGVGVFLCCTACAGHIAAEAINGCCLCFYTLLIAVVMLMEAAVVAFVAIDHQWEKDLPSDPTGEIENFCQFIKENTDICTCVSISVLVIQAMSLLLAIVLRAMVSSHKADYDSDDDYAVLRGRKQEPLLDGQSQTSGPADSNGKWTRFETWNSRLRDKYGLNVGDAKYNLMNPKV